MTNLAETINLPPSVPAAPLPVASMPGRALAALVDYVVIISTGTALRGFFPTYNYEFLFDFLIGALYFSIGNSALVNGRTLGKRVFGVSVISRSSSTNQTSYLSMRSAFVRYFFSIGVLILGAELPPLYFRHFAVVAAPYLLELNMLGVLAYFLANVMHMALDPEHLALHDRLLNSIVVRNTGERNSSEKKAAANSLSSYSMTSSGLHRIGIGLGLALALAFWSFGISGKNAATTAETHRFLLEHEFPIRITQIRSTVTASGTNLMISGVVIPSERNLSNPDPQTLAAEIAKQIAARLKELSSINGSPVGNLDFNLYILGFPHVDNPDHLWQSVQIPTETTNIELPNERALLPSGEPHE